MEGLRVLGFQGLGFRVYRVSYRAYRVYRVLGFWFRYVNVKKGLVNWGYGGDMEYVR